jgi:hypothetical protein
MIDLRCTSRGLEEADERPQRRAASRRLCVAAGGVGGTGLPDRSPGSAAVATLLGVASGLALFARAGTPFVALAATVVGYVAQVLVGGPALPVAVSVMVFVVARVLGTAAMNAARNKDRYLGARYRRLAARRSKDKALVATSTASCCDLEHGIDRSALRRPRSRLLHPHPPHPDQTPCDPPAPITRLHRDPPTRQLTCHSANLRVR